MNTQNVERVDLAGADSLVHELIDSDQDLPKPGPMVAKLIQMTNSYDTTVEALAETLSAEPAIAAHVLKLSNSAFYGRSRTINSLREAVVTLGFHTIRSMVVSCSAQEVFSNSEFPADLRNSLWEHSVATATFSRQLARELKTINPEDAYIAGLLHDIGKIILFSRFSDQYVEIAEDNKNYADALIQKEESAFGLSHPLVGAVLVNKWMFPESLVMTIGSHHYEPSLKTLSGVVRLANVFVTVYGHNIHIASETDESIVDHFGLEEKAEDFEETLQEQISVMGL